MALQSLAKAKGNRTLKVIVIVSLSMKYFQTQHKNKHLAEVQTNSKQMFTCGVFFDMIVT